MMAKIVKVFDMEEMESIITDLEKEGYKVFDFMQGATMEEVETDMPVDHPQKRIKKPVYYTMVIATGKKSK